MLTQGMATQAGERVTNKDWKPRNCVWELTLACNLRCEPCGSRAGTVRKNELSVDECLAVVDQLHQMGCELITLSGGEPTLKKGWDRIAAAIAERGMFVNMVTNGVYPQAGGAREVARRARAARRWNTASNRRIRARTPAVAARTNRRRRPNAAYRSTESSRPPTSAERASRARSSTEPA